MDLGINGRTALVCGASRGLGHAAARELGVAGVNVTLVARDPGRLDAAAARIHAESGVEVGTVAVDITTEKGRAEVLLKEALLEKLNRLPAGQQVLLKLTLPEQADFYADCVRHSKVVRVVALSGGYTQEQADARLRKNHGVIASFSRALLEGLSVQRSDAEFNATLDASIQRIYEASIT